MMVKNEEEMLPRCLESIKQAVDEIVVVDTGSSDRTMDIARDYGAEIHVHPWENDFSRHRNQSLSQAKGEWILIVDADEELRAGDGPKIRQTLSDVPPSVDGIAVDVTDIDQEGRPQATVNTIRLFRNGHGIHYEGIVHNQLTGFSEVTSSDAVIYHFGAYLSPLKMQKKNLRTRTLLFQQLREDPDNLYTLYNLTMNFAQAGESEKTLEYGEKAITLFPQHQPLHPTYVSIYTPVINACLQMNQNRRAEQYCLQAIANHPGHLDAHWLLTAILYKERRHAEVLSAGRKALHLYSRFRKGSAGWRLNLPFLYANAAGFVHLRLGLSCLRLGLWGEALAALEPAVRLHPRRKDALAEIVRTAAEVGRIDILKTYALQGRTDFPEEEIFAAALEEQRAPRDRNGLRQEAGSSEFWSRLGLSLLGAGKTREAEAALERAVQMDPDSAAAHVGLLRIRWLDKDPDGLALQVIQVLRLFGLPPAVRLSDLSDLTAILKEVEAALRNENRPDLSQITSELGKEIEAVVLALEDPIRDPA
jgi:glycosyltransferase involved in cell wall biosynthesis